MIMSAFGYVSPQTLEEAVATLASHPEGRLVAGGQSLLLPAKRASIAGSLLVDLGKIAGLRGIERKPDGAVRIGATTTIAAVASSEPIREDFPALAEAAELIGDAQVRNRATLGGSVAGVDPEADLPAVMLALDATFHLIGPRGWRTVAAGTFYVGPGQTAAARDEVVAAVVIPQLPKNSGTAYVKFKHPARLYAVCGVAAALTVANGRVAAVRVAVTGATEYPSRLAGAERTLVNGPASKEAAQAAAAVPIQLDFRGDFFASAEYRRHLTQVLTGRALKLALTRAGV